MNEDTELLRRYAEDGSESAFTQFVERQINFVHQVAMRQSGGNQTLSGDATQMVFITVARKCRQLAEHPALTGWLFQCTRNVCWKLLREERNRLARERKAMAMYDIEEERRPVADDLLLEEIDRLDGQDREAILLRFFQGCRFGAIGAALRISEDAARMRVSRGIGKLRVALERRGITSTATALATALTGPAGLGAPISLSAQVSAAALAAGPAAPLSVSGLWMAIGAAPIGSSIVAALLLTMGATSALQFGTLRQLNADLDSVLVERSALMAQLGDATGADLVSTGSGLGLPGGGAVIAQAAQTSLSSTTNGAASFDAVAYLREQLEANPGEQIPEIDLLTDLQWELTGNSISGPVEGEELLRAFISLRNRGRAQFSNLGMDALSRYAAEHEGKLPDAVADLAPYFEKPVPEAAFDRYVMLRSGNYFAQDSDTPLVGEVDGINNGLGDAVVEFGREIQATELANGDAVVVLVLRAINRYRASHGGADPESLDDLGVPVPASGRSRISAQRAIDRLKGPIPIRGRGPDNLPTEVIREQ